MFLMLSSIPEKIDTQMVKLLNDLCKDFSKEIQAMACSMKIPIQKQATPPIHRPMSLLSAKAASFRAPSQEVQFPYNAKKQAQETSTVPKVQMGGWTTVKQERAKAVNLNKRSNHIKVSPDDLVPERIIIDSDEEIDGGFSCLLKEKGTEVDDYLIREAEEETARILRKARRRKRKHCNTIIIN
ncbi:hypothetical protein ACJIZ3_016099 [Penstemon smallii]|uniref:Uncharacterized protein n=1 Tax=Penstemon smallii TaxID=265156 RepID=A0ABD3RST0_9LAMI